MSNSKRPSRPTPTPGRGTPKTTQVVIAVVAVLCVAAVVAIPLLLGGGSDSATPTVSSHPSPKSANDVTCDSPPAAPSTPQQFASAPPASLSQNTAWRATVHTTCGDIEIELNGKVAPQTVASFIFLAQKNYFNDSPCHRLTTAASGIFVLQCGDPTGTGSGEPGYGFGVENSPTNGDYPRGTLAMARGTDPNSNGSQFFIVYKDTKLPTSGGGYSIFGKVTQGLQIVDAIAAQGAVDHRPDAAPLRSISILSVDVTKE